MRPVSASDGSPARIIGRYAFLEEIASGGMATVHLGQLASSGGFARIVAIKRLHPHLARDPEFVQMFLDEARVAARIQHPNVVPVLDVVKSDGEIFLVMEYVAGESLARLAKALAQRQERFPVPVAAAIVVGVLRGLHAAHEATDERGQPLCIVHRDVSPQNILVGRDGVAHLLDFGVAKATGQLQTSRNGRIKGKVGYMPPEQARGAEVTRAVDVYAAGVVLWELLAGQPLFAGENEAAVLERVLFAEVKPPGRDGSSSELDEVVMRAVDRDPERRFATARDMARAIESAVSVASASEVGEWLESRGVLPKTSVRPPAGRELDYVPGGSSGVRPSALPAISNPTPAHRLSRAAWGIMVLLLLATAVLLGSRRRPQWASPPLPPSPVASSQSAPLPSAPPSAPELAVPSPAPAASTAPAASAAPALASVPARPSTVRPPAAVTRPVVRDACNPPYTIDADGVKQYKKQCL